MKNARFMYLRPGNLYKEFIIEENRQTVSQSGRAVNSYSGDGTDTLKGCLAEASPDTKEMWKQLGHTVTHTIVQAGSAKAKAGDRLLLDGRHFHIEGLDEMASLGIAVLYYAREMMVNER